MTWRKDLAAASGAAVVMLAIAAAALAQPRGKGQGSALEREIEQTLGVMPSYLKAYPPDALAGAWAEMKALELNPDTALTGKQKELVGLGVAAQIPCSYCSYFHTQAARLHGATDSEIAEAIAVSAQTRHWTTVMIGLAPDEQAEMNALVERMEERKPARRTAPVTDAKTAQRDIRATFGAMPAYLARFPKPALAGAWQNYRDVVLSESSALPLQTKQLIAAAVATQAPCATCVRMHAQAARRAGASDSEVAEAVAMAAVTRHWSTVLNGHQIDEQQFRSETDRIMRHLQRQTRRQSSR